MLRELEGICTAAIDAVNYRVKELGESLDDAVAAVEASLRVRGVEVKLHLSTTSQARTLGVNSAVYEVNR